MVKENRMSTDRARVVDTELFFRSDYRRLVREPNQRFWWHSMPLPNGDRIAGAHEDRNIQVNMWDALSIKPPYGLAGKTVLDVGANDGYFTIAALLCGALQVTAINTRDCPTYPANLAYAAERWNVSPQVLVGDFRSYPFRERYDVIFFLGILYHVEDVFSAMKLLRSLLSDDGVLFIETQMSQIQSPLPLFEYASDTYPTIVPQGKASLDYVGVSNYLFPNRAAILNLAASYDFEAQPLDGPENLYTKSHSDRELFRFTRQ
jgi:2-polyprenyl-3-methyl-5-hydroxy-6-metoxy-1,4-benzoquinol methylase